jgi:hypothetical protein
MTEPLVTQADLELHYGARLVLEVFSDDGGRTISSPRLAATLSATAANGEAILRRGWPSRAAIEALVLEDDGARKAFVDLAMAAGMGSKPEWTGSEAPYSSLRKEARQVLTDLADGETRSPAEDTPGVGANTNRTPRVNARAFIFSPALGATRRPGGY